MQIHAPIKTIQSDSVMVSARVEWENSALDFPPELWFRFPLAMAPYINDRADAFLIGLLLPAMYLGEDITVDGEVSPRLMRGIEDFQTLFALFRPGVLQKVSVTAENRSMPEPYDGPRAAAGTYSGGLDSFYTLWRHLPEQCPEPSRQVRYLLTLSGIPGIRMDQREKVTDWNHRQAELLQHLGVKLLEIDCNWENFQPRGLENQIAYAMPLIAAATALSALLHTFYLPGALNYDNIHPDGSTPYSDPLLNNEILEIYPHGSSVGRMGKLKAMQEWAPLLENLLVCFDSFHEDYGKNCGVCSKCLRTRMMIEMLGKTGEFKTFPVELTRKDILLWGRWLEIGFHWEAEVLQHCRRERRDLLPWVLISLGVGYTRSWLKRVLPRDIKRRIYQRTSPDYYRRYLQ